MSVPEPHDRVALVQFADLGQQRHAARLGMWLFLASEVLLFAGLFGLYTAYRTRYSHDFAVAVHHNALWIGTTNTVVLIVSSFTVAWSLHVLRAGRREAAMTMLGVTLALGVTFLTLKGIEYGLHFRDGIYPGWYYASAELPANGARLFFTLYYFMTGLHAIHMIVGIGVMTWLLVRIKRLRTTSIHHTELELGALYWHLVDSIWIFLWPLFYLAG
jgi:cytochrome c oxidase subunit 3